MDDNHYIGDPPEGLVFIGYQRGQWPLTVFSNPEHAAAWLSKERATRYVWGYNLADPVPMELVPEIRTAATLKRVTE